MYSLLKQKRNNNSIKCCIVSLVLSHSLCTWFLSHQLLRLSYKEKITNIGQVSDCETFWIQIIIVTKDCFKTVLEKLNSVVTLISKIEINISFHLGDLKAYKETVLKVTALCKFYYLERKKFVGCLVEIHFGSKVCGPQFCL